MESLKEKILKEQLDRQFGTRESAREIKTAILLSQTGKITDEMIEQYKKQKEEEYEMIRQQFTELNPSYAFDYPKELKILSNDNTNDAISDSRFGGDFPCSSGR
jgi:hypothetical protein